MASKITFLLLPFKDGSLGYNKGTEKAPHKIAEKLSLPVSRTTELEEESFGEMQEKTFLAAKELFSTGKKILSIGGDHSITYPLFRAFAETRKDAALLLFDAHADCYQVMKPASHEDYIKILVSDKVVAGKKIMMIGTRRTWSEEKAFIKKEKIRVIRAGEIKENFGEAKKKIREFCRENKEIYLSIDFDVLDAKIAFATGWPEKKGLELEELLALIEEAGKSGNIRTADFAEYNPDKDKDGKGLETSAKIIRKVLEG